MGPWIPLVVDLGLRMYFPVQADMSNYAKKGHHAQASLWVLSGKLAAKWAAC